MIVKRRRDVFVALACLAALGTTAVVPAQGSDPRGSALRLSESKAAAAATQDSSARPDDDIPALPADLLPVEGGVFEIGSSAEALLDIEEKLWLSPTQRVSDIQRLMSELGTRKVTVAPYFMSKFPVTNAQYKAFVTATGHRFPYHWWRYGQEADYEKRLEEINEAVTGQASDKGLEFWKMNWKDLPWAIPEDEISRGNKVSMDDYPVVYVAWRDALAYAAWAGMRLPSEFEWVYAATGGERREFVWGDDPDGLQVTRGNRFDRLWDVGHWGEATQGAFGHQDMALSVWEWTGELGFFSFPDDKKDYDKAIDRLFKDKLFKDENDSKVAQTLKHRPVWSGDKVVAKGGMYTSIKSELRVGTRADIEAIQTLSALGFRLAKSMIPARDMSESRLKLDYDYSMFGGGRRPNIADQVGVERYDLSPDGKQILGYHALSFVPVNYASDDKAMSKDKLLSATVEENRPFIVGTLISTEKLAAPEIDAGIYTVAFRIRGQPEDLRRALPEAKTALKTAAKTGQPAEQGEWSKTLRKYGITDEEAVASDLSFIRLNPGGLTVSTDEHMWLLRDKAGNYVHAFKSTKPIDTKPKYEDGDAVITMEAQPDGGERFKFEFGVPVDDKRRGRAYLVEFRVELPKELAGGDKWRLPVPAKK